MNRRRLLAALATAPVAGCLGQRETDTGATTTATTTRSTTDTTTTDTTSTTVESDASVSDVAVLPGLAVMNSPDSLTTTGDRDEQFVVATVTGGGSLDVNAFELDLDGETHPATTEVGYGRRIWGRGLAYRAEDGEGWLAFRLPDPRSADAATLTWPGGEHALDAEALDRLARPPTTFEVREFAVPDTAAPGDTVTATLTVANVGDADGTFVGALDRVGPLVAHAPAAAITLDVAAGATATWEYTHDLDAGGDGQMELQLDWRDGYLERTTEVKE
jgi:hypothetical protein